MSDEIEAPVRVATSRRPRQTDVALAPACGWRAPDTYDSSGGLPELDERQMPPALEVMDAELERATVLVHRPYQAESRRLLSIESKP